MLILNHALCSKTLNGLDLPPLTTTSWSNEHSYFDEDVSSCQELLAFENVLLFLLIPCFPYRFFHSSYVFKAGICRMLYKPINDCVGRESLSKVKLHLFTCHLRRILRMIMSISSAKKGMSVCSSLTSSNGRVKSHEFREKAHHVGEPCSISRAVSSALAIITSVTSHHSGELRTPA